MHFLVGREQIALDFVGDEFKGVGVGRLRLRGEPPREPCRQFVAFDLHRLDHDAGRRERAEPRAFLRAPVDFGQRDQRNRVGRQVCRIFLQSLAAFVAGLAAGDADLKYAARGEQRLRLAADSQLRPVEVLFRGQHFALEIAFFTRPRADAVGGFERQQRLVAVDDIERSERTLEFLRELFGRCGHGGVSGGAAGAGAYCFSAPATCRRRITCCTASFCMSR